MPLIVPVVQLPKSRPVAALPEVTVTVYEQLVELTTPPDGAPGFGNEHVQPAWPTSRTVREPGLTPLIV